MCNFAAKMLGNNRMAREIFISYSRWNLERVKAIKGEIEKATGAKCWMDLNAIESGAAQFTQDIVDGINTCTVFLFMLSKESQMSEFALRELNFSMLKAKESGQKHVVIVNIDGCKMCDEFLLMYGLTDTIAWQNQPQKEKLLRDMARWFGEKRKAESEVKRKAEEETKRKAESEAKRKVEAETRRKAEEEARRKAAEAKRKAEAEAKRKVAEAKRNDDAATKGAPQKTIGWFQKMKDVWYTSSKSVKIGVGIALILAICLSNYAYNFRIVEEGYYFGGLAAVKNGFKKWGYKDVSGKIVIPCKWKDACNFSEGLAAVQDKDGKWGYIDKTGEVVIPCQWESFRSFSDGLVEVQNEDGKWGYIDKTGKVVIPCQWEHASSFYEGLAAVEDHNGKWGYVDKTGKVVIPCQWEIAFDFQGGLAVVKDEDGKWFKIDKTGRVVEGNDDVVAVEVIE